MQRRMCLTAVLASVVLSLPGSEIPGFRSCTSPVNAAEADEETPDTFWENLKERIDLDPRTSFFGVHDWEYQEEETTRGHLRRAGFPQCYAPWAECPDDRHYTGYYAGGGAPQHGEPRYYRREGTWGWDYAPWWSKVRLGWWHGRRFQAGEGQYQPDKERVRHPLRDFTNP